MQNNYFENCLIDFRACDSLESNTSELIEMLVYFGDFFS